MALRRYWITFERSASLSFLDLGCGVTAFNRQDALALVERVLGGLGATMPALAEIREGVTFQDLEQNHVAPNIGNMSMRGVWFPAVNWYPEFGRE